MSTREICKCCGRESPLGFNVPDAVWLASVPVEYQNRVLCIFCFDHFATERGIEWCRAVEFWPVSGAMFARSEGQSFEDVLKRTAPYHYALRDMYIRNTRARIMSGGPTPLQWRTTAGDGGEAPQ